MSHILAWISTITVILEADVDGTLHLALPAEFREGKVRVTATLEPAPLEQSKKNCSHWPFAEAASEW